jgi:hypothetical protein
MTQQHTPGPWKANAIAKGRIIGDASAQGAEKIQINNSNATVATVYRPSDARLIAAAPDLLKALKLLLCYYQPNRSEQPVFMKGDTDFARAALAKAYGEE